MVDTGQRTASVLMAYAYSPRPSEWRSIGVHHIVVTEALHVGRLHRQPGDALCKPRSKFYDLNTEEGEVRRKDGQKFDCPLCCSRAEGLALVAADEIGETTRHLRWR